MLMAHYDQIQNKKHSLIDHLISTGQICQELGARIGLAKTSYLLGILHDIGKADRNFQERLKGSNKKVIHSSAGLKYIMSYLDKDLVEDRLWQEYIELLAYAIGAHHSVFDLLYRDKINNKMSQALYEKAKYDKVNKKYFYESDVVDFLEELNKKNLDIMGQTIEEILVESFYEYKESRALLDPIDSREEAFFTGLYARLFLSILKSGDVLDTINAYEELINLDREEEYKGYRRDYLTRIEELYKSYGQPDSEINRIRSLAGERAKERGSIDEEGIYRLDLPTGAGKTQISLRYSIHQLNKKEKSRIFYIAPYLSILEQNAQVIRDILKDGVLEHHSNLVIDEYDGDKLNQTEESYLENRDYILNQYLIESWDSPMVMTSMVQFFNSLFKNKSANLRRFASLIDSVIIMDEVQSIPIKTNYIFNSTMNFMTRVMKANIIHCTATQPNYDSNMIDYPISYGSSQEADIVSLSREERQVFNRTEVYLLNGGRKAELEDILEEVRLHEEDSFLIILNTKSSVEKLYKLAKENIDRPCYYLSTNLCPAHRLERIKEIRERLDSKEPIVCISTALIEAGVDLDFNRLIRSYSGIDSLIQAIGRCNREGKLIGQKGQVKLVYLNNHIEDLRLLEDVDKKKKIARDILLDYQGKDKIDIEEFNDRYYERYYANSKNQMSYQLSDGQNLYELLSENHYHQELFSENKRALNQAFKMAGNQFNLIEDNTIGLIVHYKESSQLIYKLEEAIDRYKRSYDKEDYKEIKKITRQLQPYTVSVYNIRKLENYIIPFLDGKILVLSETNYNHELGLSLEEDYTAFQI